jgi:putative phosphoesterase
MKLLIVSDIHGNLHALENVTKKIPYDALLCCGDLVVDYPFPEQCINTAKNAVTYICSGNNDYVVAHDRKASEFLREKYAHYAEALDRATDLTRKLITDESKRYLAGLPRECEFALDGISFYMNHTVPRMSLHHYLDLNTPLPELAAYYGDIQAEVILTGHTHVPYVKKLGNKILINPGSVGGPRDRDPRPSFVTFDTSTGQIQLRRFEYDTAETKRVLKELNFPNYSLFCLRNGYLPDNPDEA